MSKLLEDPKIAELVAKREAFATKTERKRVLQIIKDHKDSATADKAKDAVTRIKSIDASIKSAA